MIEPRTLALFTIYGLHGVAFAAFLFDLDGLASWLRTASWGALAVMLVDYGYERWFLEDCECDDCRPHDADGNPPY